MKKLSLAVFCIISTAVLFNSGCSDGAVGDDFVDNQYEARGALVSAANVVTGFFDQLDPSTSSIGFDMIAEGAEAVNSVDVNVSYNGGGEVLLQTVSDLGSSVTVNFTDVLAAVAVATGDVEVGDNVTLTFDASTSTGSYRSSNSLNVPVSCFSDLGGTYDYVGSNLVATNGGPCPAGEVTGSVTFTDQGGGTYLCSDLGFGQYESSCWNDAPASSANATFMDVCNEIISGGQDQYGLTYIWEITDVAGPNLSMSWTNDYGDAGDVVITRTDGSDWPPLFTN
jgi:hypothetical protein